MAQDLRWLDMSVNSGQREGAGGIFAMEREADGKGDGGEEERTSGGDWITKAKATRAVGQASDVASREG